MTLSGRFVVRIQPELHRKIYTQARLAEKSLNQWVTDVLERVMQVSEIPRCSPMNCAVTRISLEQFPR